MESLFYMQAPFIEVPQQNKLQFFKELPKGEGSKVKTMYNTIKAAITVPDKSVRLFTSDGVYKYVVLDNSNGMLGELYFMPSLSRLDVFVPESQGIPFIQVVRKQLVFRSYGEVLKKLGADKLFSRLINIV